MRRVIFLLFIFNFVTITVASASPATLLDLLKSEDNLQAGKKHISKDLTSWMKGLIPDQIMFDNASISGQRNSLVTKKDELAQKQAEQARLSNELGLLKDTYTYEKSQYELQIISLRQTLAILRLRKDDIPAYMKSIEQQYKGDKLKISFFKSWLSTIAQQEELAQLADSEEAVNRARDSLKNSLAEPIDGDQVKANIKALDTQLAKLIADICKISVEQKSNLCGVGDEAALEKYWQSEKAKIDKATQTYLSSLKGAISSLFWKENPLPSKLIRLLTEQRLVRGVALGVAQIQTMEAKIEDLSRRTGGLQAEVANLKAANGLAEQQLLPSLRKWNLMHHRLYSIVMGNVIEKIRESKASGKAMLTNAVNNVEVPIKDLKGAFIVLMHSLEKFEFAVVDELGSENPYPEIQLSYKDWINDHFNPARQSTSNYIRSLYEEGGIKLKDNNIRETKKDIMWNYYLALYGIETTKELYGKLGSSLKSSLSATDLSSAKNFLNNFTASNIVKYISDFSAFSSNYPILATDLSRNLMHSYSILFPSQSNNLLSSIQRVYGIKEVENVARDWLLGELDQIYTAELTKEPPSVEALAFIDFAERAPYLCAAYQGANGKTFVSGWVQELLGTGVAGKAAGSIAGFFEVKGEKYLASKISRDHEIAASVLRRSFMSFYNGKNAKDVATEAASYVATRSIVREIGTIKNLADKKLLLEEIKGCLKDNAKEGVATGIAATPFALLAGTLLMLPAAPFWLPVVAAGGIITGCVVAGVKIADVVMGKRAKRMTDLSKKFLERFELPVIQNERDKTRINAAAELSEDQVNAILKEGGDAAQLAAYKRSIETNLATLEEQEFKAGFINTEAPDAETRNMLNIWEKLNGVGQSERAVFAKEALDLLQAKPKQGDPEKQLLEKMNGFISFLAKSSDKAEVDRQIKEIGEEIKLLPFRQMKAALIKS